MPRFWWILSAFDLNFVAIFICCGVVLGHAISVGGGCQGIG